MKTSSPASYFLPHICKTQQLAVPSSHLLPVAPHGYVCERGCTCNTPAGVCQFSHTFTTSVGSAETACLTCSARLAFLRRTSGCGSCLLMPALHVCTHHAALSMDFVYLCQLPECLDRATCVPMQSACCLDNDAYDLTMALIGAMPDACLFRPNPALLQEGKDPASTETLESRQSRCFLCALVWRRS